MKKSTSKKLLIACAIAIVLIVCCIVGFRVAVNNMFSKVTQTINGSEILKTETQMESDETSDNGEDGGAEDNLLMFDREKLKEIESKISVNDKLAVLSILTKALPADEYSKILSYASGGFSKEEISDAYRIVKENLTDEQKAQIMEYYAKYSYLLKE